MLEYLLTLKALDTVNHNILFKELHYYGSRGSAKDCFFSYFIIKSTEWETKLSLSGFNSSIKQISIGVPEGSVLVPLLFLVYINDLNACVKYLETFHLADTNMHQSHSSLETLVKRMNIDLENLSQWLANKLSQKVSLIYPLLIHKSYQI